MTRFGFRIRFTAGPSRIGITETSWELADGVALISIEPGKAIKEATELAVRGESYNTDQDALNAGRAWLDPLRTSLARLNVPAEFRDDNRSKMWLAPAGRKMMGEAAGVTLLNDVRGLSAYPILDPPVQFFSGAGDAYVASNEATAKTVLAVAAQGGIEQSPAQRLAYDLYAAASFQQAVEARLLLLVAAIETLLELEDRDQAAQAHVDQLIELTRTSVALDPVDARSMIGSLRWFRQESINAAGRKLAATLAGRTYLDVPLEQFFADCYSLRSRLLHGNPPRPTHQELSAVAPKLSLFVSQLLSGPLLDAVDG